MTSDVLVIGREILQERWTKEREEYFIAEAAANGVTYVTPSLGQPISPIRCMIVDLVSFSFTKQGGGSKGSLHEAGAQDRHLLG